MSGNTLTGRRRYRVHKPLLGKPIIVLQVEVEGFVTYHNGGMIDCELEKWWIDASLEHISLSEEVICQQSG